MFLPLFPVFARGQQDDIVPVVDVIQGIPRLGADASEVPLPFEHQQIFPGGRLVIDCYITYVPSFKRVVLGEQRDGDIEVGPEVDHVGAGLGQHGLAHLKAQILCVVRPGA